jgi:hypothetical protein
MVWCCGAHGFLRNLLSGEDAMSGLGLGRASDVPSFPCASGSLGTNLT